MPQYKLHACMRDCVRETGVTPQDTRYINAMTILIDLNDAFK